MTSSVPNAALDLAERAREQPSQFARYDAELDFFSPAFNAARALACIGLRPPDPTARPLDNLYRCRPLLPADHPDAAAAPAQQQQQGIKGAAGAAERSRLARTSVVAARAAAKAPRTSPIEELASRVREGPLTLLRRAYAARARLRVVTRHGRGVRGVAEGALVAFDKYMNLVLRCGLRCTSSAACCYGEQDSFITAPAASHAMLQSAALMVDVKHAPCRDVEESYTVLLRGVERAVGLPGSGRTRRAPKQERRTRKLRQVFLRGDSVVLVSAVAGTLPPLQEVVAASRAAAAASRAERQQVALGARSAAAADRGLAAAAAAAGASRPGSASAVGPAAAVRPPSAGAACGGRPP